VAVLFATDRDDPVIRQLHELLKPRSAELPPQVPSRRSPSVDRTTGAVRPVPPPAIRHEIHEAFMTSPPPSSAGDTSSADHLLGLISAQIRPPRRVNTWSTDCTPSRPARVSQVGKVGLEVMPITTVTLSKGNGPGERSPSRR
jgi:hypothetical protein